LRICIISDCVFETPHEAGHGLGRVVSTVAEGLLAKGHDITLVAKVGSRFSGKLITPEGAQGYEGEWLLAKAAYHEHQRNRFDVFLSHDHMHVLADMFPNLPVVNVYNDNYQPYRRCPILLSKGQRALLSPEFERAAIIPNALDPNDFELSLTPDKQDYALFLGVITSIKQPLLAIEACARMGIKLVMAGASPSGQLPFANGGNVQYVGPVSGQYKADLLKGARVFLQLGTVESFGLTTLEANLSGTPVVGWPAGGTLDIIANGINGVFVNVTMKDKVAAVVNAIERAWYMDRATVRKYTETISSVDRQLDAYEFALSRVARGEWWG
jgi:glycosyltransferase involved in cell wall biosynthesis